MSQLFSHRQLWQLLRHCEGFIVDIASRVLMDSGHVERAATLKLLHIGMCLVYLLSQAFQLLLSIIDCAAALEAQHLISGFTEVMLLLL